MSYNPKIHHRKSIRLEGYDYLQAGLYFVTICVQDRKCLFGKIENDEMILNDFGTIAYQQWEKLPGRFANMELDVFQIMPNHMHAIIMLTHIVGAGFTPASNAGAGFTRAPNDGSGFTPSPNDAIGNDGKLVAGIVGAGFTPAPNDAIDNDGKLVAGIVGSGFTPAPNDAIDNDGKLVAGIVGSGFTPAPNDAIGNDGKLVRGVVGAGFTPAPAPNDGKLVQDEIGAWARAGASPAPTKPKTVGDIVGAYKSLVANGCLEIFKQKNPDEMMGKLWQRNYHEHIVRDEQSYHRIADYIINNPAKWEDDKFYDK